MLPLKFSAHPARRAGKKHKQGLWVNQLVQGGEVWGGGGVVRVVCKLSSKVENSPVCVITFQRQTSCDVK